MFLCVFLACFMFFKSGDGASWTVSNFAGPTDSGQAGFGFSGDGGQASAAKFFGPREIWIDTAVKNFFIADGSNNIIRNVDLNSNIINPFTNKGSFGSQAGDGLDASDPSVNLNPTGLCGDSSSNLYFTDEFHSTVRKINSADHIISLTITCYHTCTPTHSFCLPRRFDTNSQHYIC